MAFNPGQNSNFYPPQVVYTQHGPIPSEIPYYGYEYYLPTNTESVPSYFENLIVQDSGLEYVPLPQINYPQYQYPNPTIYGNVPFVNQIEPRPQQYYIYTETANPQGGIQPLYLPGMVYVNPHTQIRQPLPKKLPRKTKTRDSEKSSDSDGSPNSDVSNSSDSDAQSEVAPESDSDKKTLSSKPHKKTSKKDNVNTEKGTIENLKTLKLIKIHSYVRHLKSLTSLGNFVPINPTNPAHGIITKYVKNSHNIRKRKGTFRLYEIYECSNSNTTQNPSNELSVLLWFKTTPESVKRLSMKQDKCVAFYDRICRASVVQVDKLTQSLRQIILLCSVTLGRVQKSEFGYGHWSKHSVPSGFDSVMGQGKLAPNWEDNREHDCNTFPCGRTTEIDRDPNIYELEFNEYLVFTAKQIKVKYAVDFEITIK